MNRGWHFVGSIAWALLLALGFTLVWGVATAPLLKYAESQFRPARAPSERLVFDSAKRPLIVTDTTTARGERGNSYRDLMGQPVAEVDESSAAALAVESEPEFGGAPWKYRILGYAPTEAKTWFLIQEVGPNGLSYFIGYDTITRQPVGFIGTQGFRESELGDQEKFAVRPGGLMYNRIQVASAIGYRFPRSPRSTESTSGIPPDGIVYVNSAGKVFEVNLVELGVRVCFGADKVRNIRMLPHDDPQNVALAVLTDTKVTLVRYREEAPKVFLLPPDLVGKDFGLVRPAADTLLAYIPSACETLADTTGSLECFDLQWFDPSGKVLRTEQVSLHSPPKEDQLVAIAVPAPALLLAGLGVTRLTADATGPTLSEVLWQQRWSMAIVSVVVAACLLVVLRRQRKFSAGSGVTLVWLGFVALLGLPGLFAYWFHRDWPVVEECPNCHQPSPRDRAKCARCQRAFPGPILKGTEVFA